MMKQITQLEHIAGERIYHFACDPNSPINEVKEALYKFLGYVDAVEQKIKETQQQNPPDISPVDVSKDEIKNV